MDLSTASQWAEVIGLVTILGAAIYSWYQINELKKSREAVASLSLAELFQDTEFSHGCILIFRQPDSLESIEEMEAFHGCLLYTSPSPRDRTRSRMPSSA